MAPLIYKNNSDLWVSNSVVDYYCDLVVEISKLQGNDISFVYTEEPGIAGCYGISGMGINLECFFNYFGGKGGFITHLKTCRNKLSEVCETEEVSKNMYHIFSWSIYLLNNGSIPEGTKFYDSLPSE